MLKSMLGYGDGFDEHVFAVFDLRASLGRMVAIGEARAQGVTEEDARREGERLADFARQRAAAGKQVPVLASKFPSAKFVEMMRSCSLRPEPVDAVAAWIQLPLPPKHARLLIVDDTITAHLVEVEVDGRIPPASRPPPHQQN